MYQHILWDFDGTLFDTYPVMAAVFERMLRERGIAEPPEEIQRYMRVSMTVALRHYREKYALDAAFLDEYKHRRRDAEKQACHPFPGVDALLRHICDSGRANYLYTHRSESANDLLQRHGIAGLFADFITSVQKFARKPSPDAIRYLMGKHRMDQDTAVMIGDRELDILAAKNAGIDAIFFGLYGDCCAAADVSVSSIGELAALLD